MHYFLAYSPHAQEQLGKSAQEMRDLGLVAGIHLSPWLSVYGTNKIKVKLTDIFKKKYTVVTLNCLTCPGFYRSYHGVEADYKNNKDVDFYYLYKRLAHQENHCYVDACTMEERFTHIKEAKTRLRTMVP